MEAFLFLILTAWAILFFVVFPVWALVAVRRSERKVDDALAQLEELRLQVGELRKRYRAEAAAPVAPSPVTFEAVHAESVLRAEPSPAAPPQEVASTQVEAARSEPPPVTPPRRTPPPFVPPPAPASPTPGPAQPSAPPEPPVPPPAAPPSAPEPQRINWERFMGVNLFAWIGGFVLFLAAAFFVKYSIDNNLISPEIRVAIGFLLGAGLLVAGTMLSARQYRVTAHTLCATAVLILYADIFAAHAFYSFIGQFPTFLLMLLITTVAILLAVRLDAKVVAVLGLLGGFLTPVLLSTGVDNPLGLFGYIAFLDAGLVVVVLRKRWSFLVILAAVGTVLMQIGWAAKFFAVSKVFIAMGVFFTFDALFLAAFLAAAKLRSESHALTAAAILMPFVTLSFLFYLLFLSDLGPRPGVLFTYALVADLCLLALSFKRPSLLIAFRIAGVCVFFLLAIWTLNYLNPELLNWALGLYMAFAVFHAAVPLVLQRLHPDETVSLMDQVFTPLALLLALIPVFRLTEISTGFWFVILLIDALAILLSLITATVSAVIAVLILTVISILVWMLRMPMDLTGMPDFLAVTAGFTLVFFAAGLLAGRKIAKKAAEQREAGEEGESEGRDKTAQVPALAAVLPFLLLILAVLHLPMNNPTPVFGLGLLLVVLLLGLCRLLRMQVLFVLGFLCMAALEYTWHGVRFHPESATPALLWYLLFYALFGLYPFVFAKDWDRKALPWATAALSAPVQFHLIYRLVSAAYPNAFMGLLPAAFAVPSFAALALRLRSVAQDDPSRNAQLAWFGGVTLFFITLIFPIQFERQWILIGWALEGMALLWLLHRVPHDGLKVVGVGLLIIAFAGLVNPGFFLEHPRSTMRIFNWYLYTYGIVSVALMLGAKLMAPPRNKIGNVNVQPLLYSLGTLLVFLLMNLEIADYYAEGPVLVFQFSGNFARDMTYSIAWACFAFGLLVIGIRKSLAPARYASMGLLGCTLLKLFFHDLASLKQLYRVAALVVVAIVLILASYLYQRFVTFEPKPNAKEE